MKKIIDGKINPTEYDNASCKILWILKEANVSAEDKEKELNICEGFDNDWHKKNALSVPTFRKMIYATFGILNPNIEWANIPYANQEAYKVVKQIAYININKFPADSSSNDKEIKEAYNEGKVELLKQIEYLNPNIIIFGNTLKYFEYEDLSKINWDISKTEKKYADKNTNNTAFYIISPDKLCINAYHPSYPKIADKTYWNEIKNTFIFWKSNK
ncbi:hypothetical protein H4V97_000466 [Flavobacterium sp. CG_23.5]|uniref:hypothetical protein n=1 Tax=unclassified Flavobacterium TaxID=196869 RepID=UPI0018CB9519|nr:MULTISPECIES: hypothetical protein [unclassified Flavobacterium]MBG6111360.1 hypothetical protein [Flavobacterium sp. CG_9.10]MBP2282148.1 hypothetical protein [Flavobacterium sp. CG_23.5]